MFLRQFQAILFIIIIICIFIESFVSVTSPITPYTNYNNSVELEANVADLWWTTNEVTQEILFELHVHTTGWIALGISAAGGMYGADIGVGWIDPSNHLYFQDRYAFNQTTPIIDNTTKDWFPLQGREQDGWTAIQFKRAFDTCDDMDVPIQSGINKLIYAYGLVDPTDDITYHETRRGSRILSLRFYIDPPSENKFAELEFFDFRLNNYTIPPNDTTYYCKVYRVPRNLTTRRHAIANEFLVDPSNRNFIHHILVYECDYDNLFNDSQLPEGICNRLSWPVLACYGNIAMGWAVGGDTIVEYPQEAGYVVGGDSQIRHYLVEVHYNNPTYVRNINDSSGIRFFLSNQLRQYDIGFLTFGTNILPTSLAIPPKAQSFTVDSYCPHSVTANFPQSGITVISAFPHAHLQGRSVSTKLIRNGVAVQYLFNNEVFNFNYQLGYRLVKTIKLYPGDEFITRCVYNTMSQTSITIGGEAVYNEMCLHIFTYYPRMSDAALCLNTIPFASWQAFAGTKSTTIISNNQLVSWLRNINWTLQLALQWQDFYNNAPRSAIYGRSESPQASTFSHLPDYQDLKVDSCMKNVINGGVHACICIDLNTIYFLAISLVILLKCH